MLRTIHDFIFQTKSIQNGFIFEIPKILENELRKGLIKFAV